MGLAVVGIVVLLALVDGLVIWNRVDSVDAALSGSASGGTTFLLIGSDSRTDVPASERARFGSAHQVPGERADIVLTLRVTDSGAVRVLGIPRDLVLYRHRSGPERLASMLLRGPGAVADALCNSLGIGVDHLVVLHFAGLQSLVDLAGGIDVRSNAVMADHDSGLLLQRGVNHMNGTRALAYVRARHIEVQRDGEMMPDDVASAERPQRAITVLTALGARLGPSWTSPWTTQRLLWTAAGAVTVDGGSGPRDLLRLESAARHLGRTVPETLPVVARAADPVPIDALGPGARSAVRRFNGPGAQPTACSTPALLSGS